MGDFWAAVVGAVVGGGIAIIAQIVTAMLASRAHRKDIALSLLLKQVRIHSNAKLLASHVAGQLDQAERLKLGPRLWNKLQAISNLPPEVVFSSEEHALLWTLGDEHLTNIMLIMDVRHNSALAVMRQYGELRSQLSQAVPAEIKDRVGSIAISPEQAAKLAPLIEEVESLAAACAQYAARDAAEAKDTLVRLHAFLIKKAGMKRKFKLNL